jgi:2-dehydro-3-deoxyphosphogluconate aldolase/(4S)-4-hydroxy-2-oxoglutarate aldolase
MGSSSPALAALREDRVLAVVRARTVPDPRGLADALLSAGIRCIEITFTVEGALAALEAAAETEAIVGAGTVLTPAQARHAHAAGARFLVSPVADTAVLDAAAELGLPMFPGALSPTEVLAAHRAGAAAVKVFPARLGGPDHIRDLRAPFPDIDLLPSGGVDESNAAAFLEAGALAVSTGTSTIPPGLVEAADHAEIERLAGTLVRRIG